MDGVGLSSELCNTKIQMPANETPQLKVGEVSESIARALNQLELVVNALHHSTGRSMFKVIGDFFQLATYLHTVGYRVSMVNPARIKAFGMSVKPPCQMRGRRFLLRCATCKPSFVVMMP